MQLFYIQELAAFIGHMIIIIQTEWKLTWQQAGEGFLLLLLQRSTSML